MMKRILAVMLAATCLVFVLSGCESLFADIIGSGSGNYSDGRIGDKMTNVFFSFTVNEAYLADEFAGKVPEEGNIFLVAEITVKNEFGEPLPMGSYDFQIQWSDGDEDYGYPIDQFDDSQMDDEYEMKTAETLTKLVVYEIPRIEEENEYSISFLEYFEDGTEGDVFFVYFDLEP